MSAATDPVERALAGYQDTAMVLAAVRLDLPDLIEGGAGSVADLADAAGCRPDLLARLLRGLELLGLVDLDGGCRLTPAGRTLLRGSASPYREQAELVADQYWAPWSHLDHTVRTGETAFDHLHGAGVFDWRAANPGSSGRFTTWLDRATASSADALAAAMALDGPATVADLAGGGGALLRAVLRRDAGIEGTLVDRPEVVEAAAAGWPPELADRTRFVAGDLFEGVPVAADTYLLKSVLHDWDDERAVAVLRACAASMPTTSRLFVVERTLDDAPASTIRLDLHMLAVTGGRERLLAELVELAGRAGLAVGRTSDAAGFTILDLGHA